MRYAMRELMEPRETPPLREVFDDLIIEQAVRRAKHAGWVVMPEDCFYYGVASDESLRTGDAHAWIVYMSVQPYHNPNLQRPSRLECRVELLGDCLCAVELRVPESRAPRIL